jgi:predicted enzyme related to lactoylglutathione lyase
VSSTDPTALGLRLGLSADIGDGRRIAARTGSFGVQWAPWFYGMVLGLPRSRTNPDEFEAANVTLTLWQPETQNVPFAPNTAGVALRVPDVDVARERLAASGVEFLGDTVDTGVCRMGFFYDPDGNVLILHRRYAPLDS